MTIDETKDVIEIWIDGLKTFEQLCFMQDIIDDRVYARFKNHVSPAKMGGVLSYLEGVMSGKRKELAKIEQLN
jgi:hypothetical protein